ncbi:MAG: nucleotidyltransferase domain-containing protein [Spirochaeta sp.]|jgi:predicted nucleotidyltransferase|nr:nucleotidyltransferase domain-containing protein [Spirochaeta sp.]
MDKNTAIAAVTAFSDAIRTNYQPVKVVLYGSYARGDQQESSDIDVAVIVEQVKGDFLDAEAGLYRIRRQIDNRIEPLLLEMGEDRSGFMETVLRTGEVVYERPVVGA